MSKLILDGKTPLQTIDFTNVESLEITDKLMWPLFGIDFKNLKHLDIEYEDYKTYQTCFKRLSTLIIRNFKKDEKDKYEREKLFFDVEYLIIEQSNFDNMKYTYFEGFETIQLNANYYKFAKRCKNVILEIDKDTKNLKKVKTKHTFLFRKNKELILNYLYQLLKKNERVKMCFDEGIFTFQNIEDCDEDEIIGQEEFSKLNVGVYDPYFSLSNCEYCGFKNCVKKYIDDEWKCLNCEKRNSYTISKRDEEYGVDYTIIYCGGCEKYFLENEHIFDQFNEENFDRCQKCYKKLYLIENSEDCYKPYDDVEIKYCSDTGSVISEESREESREEPEEDEYNELDIVRELIEMSCSLLDETLCGELECDKCGDLEMFIDEDVHDLFLETLKEKEKIFKKHKPPPVPFTGLIKVSIE